MKLENDLLKFVEVMQKQKRMSNSIKKKAFLDYSEMDLTDVMSQ